jgi:hypothetical protein
MCFFLTPDKIKAANNSTSSITTCYNKSAKLLIDNWFGQYKMKVYYRHNCNIII